MNRKAIIFGIKGTRLSIRERTFLKKVKPWGIILFSRNIESIEQLKNLTNQIKNIFNDRKYPILVDQEGGAVCRLNKIIDLSLFSNDFFGKLYKKNKKLLSNYYAIYIDTLSDIFKKTGININTAPVLDVRTIGGHKIIGNRSFSSNPYTVSKLGRLMISLFNKNRVGTVIKHIPGHGKAIKDSHMNLSIINSERNELIKKDFLPFKLSQSFFAMTAHIIYKAYDPINTATHSKTIINEVIRKHIGFTGVLISDDISMKALKFDIKTNSIKALNAGCNLVLHCNANIDEMNQLSKIIPNIDNFTQKKTSDFYKFLG